jgi:hypothetical protein
LFDTCWLWLNLCSVAALDPSMWFVMFCPAPYALILGLVLAVANQHHDVVLWGRYIVCLDRYVLVAAQLLSGCSVGPQYIYGA